MLPADVEKIIESLARWAKGYRNRLKWNEEAKFKSDLMQSKIRWQPERVPVDLFRERCLAHGMTEEDTATLVGYLKRAQAGKRLVPQRSYRGFKFSGGLED
ncbi:MAG: hypothetical protein WA942_18960 [Mycolicibacter sinensis]